MVNSTGSQSHLSSQARITIETVENAELDEPPIRKHAYTYLHITRSFTIWTVTLLLFLFNHASVHALTTGSIHSVSSLDHANVFDLQKRQSSNASDNASDDHGSSSQRRIAFDIQALLIPILVILSGVFAGLTLGYMSMDSTQLCVLAKSGTPKQRKLANKIAPLRKDGHLLLITLLIANMIANETLPIVSANVLGGGIQAVVVSTVLVIIFSEIIPQSVCSTYGLQIGAACAKPVQLLVYMLYPVCWPIAKLLTKILGAHSGIIYRRAELKELVNLHAVQGEHGGDLNKDVVTIVGAAIDLQERVVRDAMTPLEQCFMLNVDTQLDYETLGSVLASGHSRIPVYEDVINPDTPHLPRRKILGALLTKQLILIDPEDGLPLRDFPLNPLPVVAEDMPMLHILNSFQEGRSHLAIVCPRQVKVAFATLPNPTLTTADTCNASSIQDDHASQKSRWSLFGLFKRNAPSIKDPKQAETISDAASEKTHTAPTPVPFRPILTEQPIGIITLEDVLEELLGEQIYDETDHDERGNIAVPPYVPQEAAEAMRKSSSRTGSSLVLIEKPQRALSKRWSLSTFRSSSLGHAAEPRSRMHGTAEAPARLPTQENTKPEEASHIEHAKASGLEHNLDFGIRTQEAPTLFADAIHLERGRRALMRMGSGENPSRRTSFKGPATLMPVPSRRISRDPSLAGTTNRAESTVMVVEERLETEVPSRPIRSRSRDPSPLVVVESEELNLSAENGGLIVGPKIESTPE